MHDSDPHNADMAKSMIYGMLDIPEQEYITSTERAVLVSEAKKFLGNVVESYGLNADDMFASWQEGSGQENFGDNVRINLERIAEIEKERPGICAELRNSIFKIRNFGRYPKDLLITQYDNRDNQDIRYGAVFYPYSDWDGSFYSDTPPFTMLHKDLQKVNQSLPLGEAKYGVRIFEVSSKQDLARALIATDRKYGQQHKIAFAFIGGHGLADNIQLGGVDGIATEERHTIQQEELQGRGIRRIPVFFEPNPTVILVSCSTGEQEGIGQAISLMGAEVIAPEIPTSLHTVHVTYNRENNKLEFTVRYVDQGTEQIYVRGQHSLKIH